MHHKPAVHSYNGLPLILFSFLKGFSFPPFFSCSSSDEPPSTKALLIWRWSTLRLLPELCGFWSQGKTQVGWIKKEKKTKTTICVKTNPTTKQNHHLALKWCLSFRCKHMLNLRISLKKTEQEACLKLHMKSVAGLELDSNLPNPVPTQWEYKIPYIFSDR